MVDSLTLVNCSSNSLRLQHQLLHPSDDLFMLPTSLLQLVSRMRMLLPPLLENIQMWRVVVVLTVMEVRAIGKAVSLQPHQQSRVYLRVLWKIREKE
ncbi:unnamed protein product [Rodentolepis nana]|uniref:Ovule protein n=1 Tax=Rodentolepis nana TaxID=102285 RepID=A0A0R3TDQ1_RODNA|nr:unnamed protein product [Rodentolepis nana]